MFNLFTWFFNGTKQLNTYIIVHLTCGGSPHTPSREAFEDMLWPRRRSHSSENPPDRHWLLRSTRPARFTPSALVGSSAQVFHRGHPPWRPRPSQLHPQTVGVPTARGGGGDSQSAPTASQGGSSLFAALDPVWLCAVASALGSSCGGGVRSVAASRPREEREVSAHPRRSMGLEYMPISWGGARGVNVDIYIYILAHIWTGASGYCHSKTRQSIDSLGG